MHNPDFLMDQNFIKGKQNSKLSAQGSQGIL